VRVCLHRTELLHANELQVPRRQAFNMDFRHGDNLIRGQCLDRSCPNVPSEPSSSSADIEEEGFRAHFAAKSLSAQNFSRRVSTISCRESCEGNAITCQSTETYKLNVLMRMWRLILAVFRTQNSPSPTWAPFSNFARKMDRCRNSTLQDKDLCTVG